MLVTGTTTAAIRAPPMCDPLRCEEKEGRQKETTMSKEKAKAEIYYYYYYYFTFNILLAGYEVVLKSF